ncbi:MAG: nucleotidyltransferase domain-containing protein [Patescibacteria group bacterium]|nr:nucleotidyltransferase domain-containing protein [Patescibacteria group bacterium]
MNTISQEIDILVQRIIERCKPQKIILFGSALYHQEKTCHDIDLFIVKNRDYKKRPQRVKEIFEAIRGVNRKYPLDVFVYTQEEIDDRLSMGDAFIKEVLEKGRIMYG